MSGNRLVDYVPDYVVFDLETTGLNSSIDRIIEIAAVKVRDRKVIDTFSTLVNPEREIPKAASRVNGITNELVANSPKLGEIFEAFLMFIGDDILVGHNIHSFDMKFVRNAVDECGLGVLGNDYIDTLYMARKCLPELSHHRLADIAEYFHISAEGAHRALNDCIINQKSYEELGKLQKNITIIRCPKCGGELIKRKGRYGEFYGCSNFPKCRYAKSISEA